MLYSRSLLVIYFIYSSVVVVQSLSHVWLFLWDPMNCSMPGLPVHYQLLSLLKLVSIKLVMPYNHLTHCHSLLLLPSVFPSIKISNESVLRISWLKYWSFSIACVNSKLIVYSSPYFSPLATIVGFLCRWVYFFFINKFICIIFLDFIYKQYHMIHLKVFARQRKP